jgi:hypothetical protein
VVKGGRGEKNASQNRKRQRLSTKPSEIIRKRFISLGFYKNTIEVVIEYDGFLFWHHGAFTI